MRLGIAVCGLAAALSSICVAQTASLDSRTYVNLPPKTSIQGPPITFFVRHTYHPFPGAPFEAEETTERSQTLASGARIHQTFEARHIYRNNAGQVRIESTIMVGTRPEPGAQVIEIYDPENGQYLVLDQYRQIVHRAEMRVAEQTILDGGQVTLEGQVIRHASGATEEDSETETDLGERVIEGVSVKGRRMSVTIPEGAIGNDRPLTQNSEIWFSEPLQLDVLRTRDDPRDGLLTIKLTNIRQVEPDPGLFTIPNGWQVVEESGNFAISFSRPRDLGN